MTVAEFERRIKAWEQEDARQMKRQAHWVACMMNATGNYKPALKADDLISGKKEEQDQSEWDSLRVRTEEQIKERAEQRKRDRLAQRKPQP